MAFFKSAVRASLLLGGVVGSVNAAASAGSIALSPEQDILLPDGEGGVSDPLVWLGANSPYFAG